MNILEGKSQAIYRKDMFEIYKTIVMDLYDPKENENKITHQCIYIDTQTDKEIILSAIEAVKGIDAEEKKLNNINQENLTKILLSTIAYTNLIIVYDCMEDVTNKREKLFRRLMRNRVVFVAGFRKMPPENRMSFFDIHEFVNKDEYELLQGENKIDITYFFYIFITLFTVLIFLRIVSLGRIGDIISSALWFGLLIFRTFSYIGGKV